MRFKDSLKTATLGLKHAKIRSLLTMLGIIIGIGSVILLMSLGESAQNLIISQVQGVGSNLAFVIPGSTKGSRFSTPAAVQGIIIKTLGKTDANQLKKEQSILRVSGDVRGSARIVAGNNDKVVTYEGVDSEYFDIRHFVPAKGYHFTRSDVESFNRVAVLGSSIAGTLFGQVDPIGKTVRIKNITFRVIGVLDKEGVGPYGVNQDDLVVIPISVAQKLLLGIDYYNTLFIEAKPDYDLNFVKLRIISVLRQNHHITDPDKDDFTVETQEDILSVLDSVTSALTVFLTAIASISLIVGGIGIMNIMLVSVVERTKEIGLRKAVGATNRDILQQFLYEAVIITFIGGAIGILFGALFTFLVYLVVAHYFVPNWKFILPPSSILLAFGVSTLTGLIFGLYPARQAARKNPIESLRYE